VHGRRVLPRRRHRRHLGGRFILAAGVALAGILLQPQPVLPEPVIRELAPVPEAEEAPLIEYQNPLYQPYDPAAEVRTMLVTAYTSSVEDCGKDDGITASGAIAGPGTISADWELHPPGTVVEVPGWGRGVVADRGGAIKGNRLDVWLPDAQAVREWGRRQVEVRVLP
jgi:3D (Asp-Asp-Asp) domain-containing protein